jgi:CRP-like cAMP-binding protein
VTSRSEQFLLSEVPLFEGLELRGRLMSLGREDFRAVVRSRDRGARELRRRLIALACSRLRERHRALAATLEGGPLQAMPGRREPTGPPDPAYLLRLPFFRHFSRRDLDDLLGRASVEQVRVRDLLLAEGERSPGLFVTLHGTVEEVIRRDGHAIRIALLGPGRGFGYASLIDGGHATATAAARERSVVFVIAADEFEHQLQHDSFASAIESDIVGALRHAARPQARLAARDGASIRQSSG